jgi:hypothetical protein
MTCRVPPHKRNVNTVFQTYAPFPFDVLTTDQLRGLVHLAGGSAPDGFWYRRPGADQLKVS